MEQVRYSRRQDMTYQSLASLYGMIVDLNDKFRAWLSDSQDRAQAAELTASFRAADHEFRRFLMMNLLWLPYEPSDTALSIANSLVEKEQELLDISQDKDI